MNSNFTPHPSLEGEGRCRVCDLPYSQMIAREVVGHRRFHRDFLRACKSVGAPVPEAVREKWRKEGLAIQFRADLPFAQRLAAAELWLQGVYNGYLFDVLLHELPNRMDLRDFFTKRLEPSHLSNFQPDVAAALTLRYSDNLIHEATLVHDASRRSGSEPPTPDSTQQSAG